MPSMKKNEGSCLTVSKAARNQIAGQTKLHEHWLRLRALQPDAPRSTTHGAQRTKVFWPLLSALQKQGNLILLAPALLGLDTLPFVSCDYHTNNQKSATSISKYFLCIFHQQNRLFRSHPFLLFLFWIFFFWTLEASIGQKPQFPVFQLSHDDFHFESGIQDIIKFFATLRDNLCT